LKAYLVNNVKNPVSEWVLPVNLVKIFPDYKAASANAKNSVIPAWMPESRAREGDYPWHPYPI